MWVVVHMVNGNVNAIYGPFDRWIDAYNWRQQMPRVQSYNSVVQLVLGVG